MSPTSRCAAGELGPGIPSWSLVKERLEKWCTSHHARHGDGGSARKKRSKGTVFLNV